MVSLDSILKFRQITIEFCNTEIILSNTINGLNSFHDTIRSSVFRIVVVCPPNYHKSTSKIRHNY